jgi:hypothetical protein
VTWPAIQSTRGFPDLTEALMDLFIRWYPVLATQPGGDFRVGRVFPEGLQSKLPYVRVRDIGGNDDGLTDVPLIDVDVFHTGFNAARDLSKGIQRNLLGTPHVVNGVVIDLVRTAMRPHDVPWDDDRVYRFYSSYQVGARR